MAMNRDYSGTSSLEREIELEMDEELEAANEETRLEDSEAGDEEYEDVLELDEELESDEEAGLDEELDEELEGSDDHESQYVDRFMEIAAREFESESEVDQAMNETLNDVASEYLFGSIWKKAKKFGKRLAKNKIVGSLVKKGLSVASGQFPALKAAMQLAKGNLQGALLNLGKQALGTVVPGSTAALGALSSLGITPGGEGEAERESWENYVQLSREAFEHLANNVTPTANQPVEANRLAANAFQHAVKRAQSRTGGGVRHGAGRRVGRSTGRVVHYQLRPGEKIVITGGQKIVVKGA
jgi:hypothetical protein